MGIATQKVTEKGGAKSHENPCGGEELQMQMLIPSTSKYTDRRLSGIDFVILSPMVTLSSQTQFTIHRIEVHFRRMKLTRRICSRVINVLPKIALEFTRMFCAFVSWACRIPAEFPILNNIVHKHIAYIKTVSKLFLLPGYNTITYIIVERNHFCRASVFHCANHQLQLHK